MKFHRALLEIPERRALPVHWAAARLIARWARYLDEPDPVTGPELLKLIEGQADDLFDRKGHLFSETHALDHAAASIWRAIKRDRQEMFANYLIYQVADIALEENEQ